MKLTKPPLPAGGRLRASRQGPAEPTQPNQGWNESWRLNVNLPNSQPAGRSTYWNNYGTYLYQDVLERSTITTKILAPDDSFVDFKFS